MLFHWIQPQRLHERSEYETKGRTHQDAKTQPIKSLQLQRASHRNHRNIARNMETFPKSSSLLKTCLLAEDKSPDREGELTYWHEIHPQTKMLAELSPVNSPSRWIFDVPLCSVPMSALREGRNHVTFCRICCSLFSCSTVYFCQISRGEQLLKESLCNLTEPQGCISFWFLKRSCGYFCL